MDGWCIHLVGCHGRPFILDLHSTQFIVSAILLKHVFNMQQHIHNRQETYKIKTGGQIELEYFLEYITEQLLYTPHESINFE